MVLFAITGSLNYKRFNMEDLRILFEDNHLIAINKRPGMLVQGDSTGDTPLPELVKLYIKKKYGKPGDVFLGVVHRLDRPVSGVVVFARTTKSLERMNALFRNRETVKIYHAIVQGKPSAASDTLIHWLVKDESKNKTTAYKREHPDGSRSELSYEVKKHADKLSLLEVRPVTGRPHQIRAQLAAIGCPIVGDLKYGARDPNDDASICLHASHLKFIHPVKKEEMVISAPLPDTGVWRTF
jgi:23S rRNA pseudouridine1911/1915/1917 synthase